MSLAELEATVQRRPEPETLAVYADALQAAGDPRGELIAIDLELARLRSTPDDSRRHDLIERKRELLTAWIGDKVGQQPWHPRNFEYGVFCGLGIASTPTQLLADYTRGVLDSPLGNRLDRVSIYGGRTELTGGLEVLIERGAPWLRKLSLQRTETNKRGRRPINPRIWQAFVTAAPHLEELTLIGAGVVATPIHPTVHTLRLPSGNGVAISTAAPGVTTIELGFRQPFKYEALVVERVVELVGAVNPRAYPNLRSLDLALNEGVPYVDNSTVAPAPGVYPPNTTAILAPAIDAIENLDRLERLRLTSVLDDASARYVIELAERHPMLSIEIARMYVALEGFVHPRIRVPVARVWPASAHGRDALTIDVPTQQHGEELALSSLIDDLEGQFDAMRADQQQAWIAFWDFLDDLPWEDDQGNEGVTKQFPAATLLRALDALDGNGRADLVANLIRTARLPADAEVNVTRYWGW